MKVAHTLMAGLAVAAALGVSAWGSTPKPSSISVVKGSVLTEDNAGRWEAGTPVEGRWLKADSKDAILRVQGTTVRLQAGTKIRVQSSQGNTARLEAASGRLFVKADAGTNCQVASLSSKVMTGTGEFLVDTTKEDRLYSVKGDLNITERASKTGTLTAKAWQSSVDKLALDGPDVRRRNRNRKRFTQGEENRGKRIGEDAPPQTTSPTPPMTETPAYTPSPTPSVTPPSPQPSPTNPPPQATGGEFPVWPVVGGLVGAGLVTYLVTRNSEDETRIVGPFSP